MPTVGQLKGDCNAFPDETGRGMTLREYLAGQAMVGLLATWHHADLTADTSEDGASRYVLAKGAIRIADALLEELAT